VHAFAYWLAFASLALACNVPVFRYALERWHAEEYEAVVFHRGPLAADELAWVNALDQSDKEAPANLTLRKVNLALPLDPATEKLWQQQTNATLPWLVLRYAPSGANPPVFWAGPLAKDLATTLVDSPARREIVQRLTNGQTAVWVVLEGGTPLEDETALDLLADELKKQEKAIQLPPSEPDDPQMRSPLPVRVEFSLVRVARNNPAEHFLVQLLLAGDAHLAASTRPIAFPVFGRGRILAALTGKELSKEIIPEACAFICGPCSCEIKELNPGRDLLLAANWDAVFEGQPPPAPAPSPLIGMTQFAPATTNPPAAVLATPGAPIPNERSRLTRNLLMVLGFVVVVLAIGSFALKSRAGKTGR